MSNVLYVCPVEECPSRLFQAPRGRKGSKSNLSCRHHTDSKFEQAEDYIGPNFNYIDPERGKVNTGQTHTQTGSIQNIKTVHKTPPKETVPDEVLKERLSERYEQLFDEAPDKRWSLKTLRLKVKKEEARLEDEVKREFEEKKRAAGELD